MLFINNAVPMLGVAVMFYVMLSKRINTRGTELGFFFALSMALWVFLFWADWTKEFVAVWQTTSARVIVLIMVLCVVRLAWRNTVKQDTK